MVEIIHNYAAAPLSQKFSTAWKSVLSIKNYEIRIYCSEYFVTDAVLILPEETLIEYHYG